MDTMTLLDPTGEREAVTRRKAPRPKSLDGITIGLLDIGKARGDVFLNRIEERLVERGVAVKRYAKPTPSRLASGETKSKVAREVQAAIIGLAD